MTRRWWRRFEVWLLAPRYCPVCDVCTNRLTRRSHTHPDVPDRDLDELLAWAEKIELRRHLRRLEEERGA